MLPLLPKLKLSPPVLRKIGNAGKCQRGEAGKCFFRVVLLASEQAYTPRGKKETFAVPSRTSCPHKYVRTGAAAACGIEPVGRFGKNRQAKQISRATQPPTHPHPPPARADINGSHNVCRRVTFYVASAKLTETGLCVCAFGVESTSVWIRMVGYGWGGEMLSLRQSKLIYFPDFS